MLRQFIILIISFFIVGGEGIAFAKVPVFIRSKKVTFDRTLDIMTYEGDVRIEYQDYYLITGKMIISTYKLDNKHKLNSVEFPGKTTMVKADMSETIIVPSAIYNGATSELKSEGEIYIEKDNQLYTAKSILLMLGKAKHWKPL